MALTQINILMTTSTIMLIIYYHIYDMNINMIKGNNMPLDNEETVINELQCCHLSDANIIKDFFYHLHVIVITIIWHACMD